MKETNWQQDSLNYKKKDKKFSMDRQMIKIEKKDSEEQLIRSKDIIDAL